MIDIVRQAIQAADKAEERGRLDGYTKRSFAGAWLFNTDIFQEELDFNHLLTIKQMVDELDDYYGGEIDESRIRFND